MNDTKNTQYNELSGYRFLIGEKGWGNLHPDIKKRFSEQVNHSVVYKGMMSEIYLSFAGKLLAQVCRLIGTPLALYNGKNIPIEVKVYENRELRGMTWDRFYHYSNKVTNRIKSTKVIAKNGGLVEIVGYGFGMALNVYEKQGALFFESTQFFLKLGKLKINIPDILSPGKTIVSQKALNESQFQFSLDVTHSWLGKIFKQIGVFEAVD